VTGADKGATQNAVTPARGLSSLFFILSLSSFVRNEQGERGKRKRKEERE
jgi:hypothetical protein